MVLALDTRKYPARVRIVGMIADDRHAHAARRGHCVRGLEDRAAEVVRPIRGRGAPTCDVDGRARLAEPDGNAATDATARARDHGNAPRQARHAESSAEASDEAGNSATNQS